MAELAKIKYDNGTMSVRLPKAYCQRKKLQRNGYMIWKENAGGNLSIKPLDEELKRGNKISTDIHDDDNQQQISDENSK